jgi:hypothetical protein
MPITCRNLQATTCPVAADLHVGGLDHDTLNTDTFSMSVVLASYSRLVWKLPSGHLLLFELSDSCMLSIVLHVASAAGPRQGAMPTVAIGGHQLLEIRMLVDPDHDEF